jgi:Glycine rich protein/HYR domain
MALITGAGLTAAMAVAVPGAASAASAAPMDLPLGCTLGSTVVCTFTYTGSQQTFVVPSYVRTVHVTAIGAAGGDEGLVLGGEGGSASARLSVRPGHTLYVEVGGVGANASATLGADAQAGGFNGGGYGSASDPASHAPASGGGASDVRTMSGGIDPATTGLGSRLIVAGGGGGAASCGGGGAAGQHGIYTTSGVCTGLVTSGGGAGTTIAGGAAGGGSATAGTAGQGGDGGPLVTPVLAAADGGGGGGGGYFGGGGGGLAAGGGGGSSWAPRGTTGPADTAASVTISFTGPRLYIHGHRNITVDATSPAGAVVTYTVPMVYDQANPLDPPTAVCTPPSGSTFAIGTTTVTCTATDPDDYNSPASRSFTVYVVGAPGQLAALYSAVRGYGPALAYPVLIAEHAVDTENTPRACLALDVFILEVATRVPPLPPVTAAYLIAAAAQIQAVLGCGGSWLP